MSLRLPTPPRDGFEVVQKGLAEVAIVFSEGGIVEPRPSGEVTFAHHTASMRSTSNASPPGEGYRTRDRWAGSTW